MTARLNSYTCIWMRLLENLHFIIHHKYFDYESPIGIRVVLRVIKLGFETEHVSEKNGNLKLTI